MPPKEDPVTFDERQTLETEAQKEKTDAESYATRLKAEAAKLLAEAQSVRAVAEVDAELARAKADLARIECEDGHQALVLTNDHKTLELHGEAVLARVRQRPVIALIFAASVTILGLALLWALLVA